MKRAGIGAGVVLVAAVLTLIGYVLGTSGGRSGPPGAVPPPPNGPGVFVPVAAAADPLMSAAAWLRGYRQQSWTDPEPSSWMKRVAPVVTGSLAREYQDVLGAGGGQEWRDFVARRCVSSVTPPGGVIPPEAPHSASQVWVQVSADVLTHCQTGPAPGQPVEHMAATVELARGSDGLWRVSQRAF